MENYYTTSELEIGESYRTGGESSDTESAEHTTERKPKMTFVSVFKKKSDKVAADKEALKNVTVDDEKNDERKSSGESVVYAELDLSGANAVVPVVVRGDDKTEYAEIIHTQPPATPK